MLNYQQTFTLLKNSSRSFHSQQLLSASYYWRCYETFDDSISYSSAYIKIFHCFHMSFISEVLENHVIITKFCSLLLEVSRVIFAENCFLFFFHLNQYFVINLIYLLFIYIILWNSVYSFLRKFFSEYFSGRKILNCDN